MCVKGINWQWLPSPLRLSSVLGCCVRLMLLGADPLLEGWRGGAGEAHATTARFRFPVLLTSGISFVRFTSVAQNSVLLEEWFLDSGCLRGWAVAGFSLLYCLPGSRGCILAVGLSLGGQAVAGLYLLYCLPGSVGSVLDFKGQSLPLPP